MSALAEARALRRQGRFREARERCAALLAEDPGQLDVQHLMGRLQHDEGRSELAALILAGVAAQRPEDPHVLASQARALVGAGDAASALPIAERAVALAPRSARARRALAAARGAAADVAGSRQALEAAIERDPGHPGARVQLVELLFAAGEHAAGAHALGALAGVDPTATTRLEHVAVRLAAAGRRDAAEAVLRAGLDRFPRDPGLEHLLAAHAGAAPARASDAYVRRHFDGFADGFDDRLARLGYSGPQPLLDLAGDLLHAPATVLDLGCGTGLGGPLLRPVAGRLVGVDLSPRMLDRAAALGVYDELAVAEATAWCREHADTYDLVLAADVLIYFGDLGPILTAVAAATVPGGIVLGSVERGEGALTPTGRWTHTDAAVDAAAATAGLTELRSDTTVLRKEGARQVDTRLVAWRRA